MSVDGRALAEKLPIPEEHLDSFAGFMAESLIQRQADGMAQCGNIREGVGGMKYFGTDSENYNLAGFSGRLERALQEEDAEHLAVVDFGPGTDADTFASQCQKAETLLKIHQIDQVKKKAEGWRSPVVLFKNFEQASVLLQGQKGEEKQKATSILLKKLAQCYREIREREGQRKGEVYPMTLVDANSFQIHNIALRSGENELEKFERSPFAKFPAPTKEVFKGMIKELSRGLIEFIQAKTKTGAEQKTTILFVQENFALAAGEVLRELVKNPEWCDKLLGGPLKINLFREKSYTLVKNIGQIQEIPEENLIAIIPTMINPDHLKTLIGINKKMLWLVPDDPDLRNVEGAEKHYFASRGSLKFNPVTA